MKTAKLLVLAGCTRCLELLAEIDACGATKKNKIELVAKMKELRRDTVRLEELMNAEITVIRGKDDE